jgi:hypothetical protein
MLLFMGLERRYVEWVASWYKECSYICLGGGDTKQIPHTKDLLLLGLGRIYLN